jgi:hypothetical protein
MKPPKYYKGEDLDLGRSIPLEIRQIPKDKKINLFLNDAGLKNPIYYIDPGTARFPDVIFDGPMKQETLKSRVADFKDLLGKIKNKFLHVQFAEAARYLKEDRQRIIKLIERMRMAQDLPPEDRDYYIPFMEHHLHNFDDWDRAVKKLQAKIKKAD